MVIVKISATEKLLHEMTSQQIMYFLEKYGNGFFRRKKMIIIEGMHWILAMPEEIESGELSKKYQIGARINGELYSK